MSLVGGGDDLSGGSRGISTFLSGGDDGGSHGDLDGELEGRSVGKRDLLSVDGETSGLAGLVLELNKTISARAAVAHANDVGRLGLVLSEEGTELLVISAEGHVGDEEGGLGSGTNLSRATRSSGATGGVAASTTGSRGGTLSSRGSGSGSLGGGGGTVAASTTTATTVGRSGSLGGGSRSLSRRGAVGLGGTGLALLGGSLLAHLLLGSITGAGQLDIDGTTRDLLLVHGGDSLLSLSLVGELDESISEGAAATGDDVGRETIYTTQRDNNIQPPMQFRPRQKSPKFQPHSISTKSRQRHAKENRYYAVEDTKCDS